MFEIVESHNKKMEFLFHAQTVALKNSSFDGGTKEISVITDVSKKRVNECPVCLELPKAPVRLCKDKKHILCRSCCKKIKLNNRKRCCVCNRKTKRVDPSKRIDPVVKKIINKAEYLCPAGCTQIMPLTTLRKHFPECRPFSCETCSYNGSFEDFKEHRKICKPPMKSCVYCKEEYLFNRVKEHQESCPEFPVLVTFPDGKIGPVARNRIEQFKLVEQLRLGKRPRLDIDREASGLRRKEMKSAKLTDDCYQAIESGIKILIDYYEEKDNEYSITGKRRCGSLLKPLGTVGILGLFDEFSDLFDENMRLIKQECLLASVDLSERSIERSASGKQYIWSSSFHYLMPENTCERKMLGPLPFTKQTMDVHLVVWRDPSYFSFNSALGFSINNCKAKGDWSQVSFKYQLEGERGAKNRYFVLNLNELKKYEEKIDGVYVPGGERSDSTTYWISVNNQEYKIQHFMRDLTEVFYLPKCYKFKIIQLLN